MIHSNLKQSQSEIHICTVKKNNAFGFSLSTFLLDNTIQYIYKNDDTNGNENYLIEK